MSEFIWYTRLAVWAGALILIVQAIAGRGTTFLTLFAVVAMAVGFTAFLVGLAVEGRDTGTRETEDHTVRDDLHRPQEARESNVSEQLPDALNAQNEEQSEIPSTPTPENEPQSVPRPSVD